MKELNINEIHMVSGAGAVADDVENSPGYQAFKEGVSQFESVNTPMIDVAIENGKLVVDLSVDVIDTAFDSVMNSINKLFA